VDGGEEIYLQFAREEATDRRRRRAALAAALVAHLLVLAAPLSWGGGPAPVALPPAPATAFRLQALRFAPPQPPTAPPAAEDAAPAEEPADPGPPPAAAAELLVPRGPAGDLVPPQPLDTPPPPVPPELWRRGLGGEVTLTLVVDTAGEVAHVTVEAVDLEDARIGEGSDGAAASAALADALGRSAAEAVRRWLFLPATLSGNPISTAVSVRVSYPAAAPPPPP